MTSQSIAALQNRLDMIDIQVDALRGMDIAITTTAKTDAEAKALLAAFNFPFRN